MTQILLDESAPGKPTLEHCCVFARPESLGFTNFEKENTSVHTGRHCGVCDLALKNQPARHPNNPLWGDGGGWALFKSDAPNKQVATDYKKDCLGCHIPAKTDDWIYVKGYPVLHGK
jgi:hypothetical protein